MVGPRQGAESRGRRHPPPGTAAMKAPLRRVLLPLQEFIHTESSSGLVLLACALGALAWANLAPASYAATWETHARVGLGPWSLDLSLRHWINDGLMTVFFLLVGLEIKRELLVGELSTFRTAALPAAAALGGMLVPAGLFTLVARGTPAARGWGIPMATDIAFALGLLALLGRRVPLALKVFLAALAIADDLGAVLVIALFYTERVDGTALGMAAGFFAVLLASNWLGIRTLAWYLLLGLGLWFELLHSGVHATVAGVLLALAIPAWSRHDLARFQDDVADLAGRVRQLGRGGRSVLANQRLLSLVAALEETCGHVQPPLHRLEHHLSTGVAMVLMPLFALANAGVPLAGAGSGVLSDPLAMGIGAGLVLGKPVGIALGTWGTVRLGLGALPRGVGWPHVWGLGLLGGVGFTMALFISGLALGEGPRMETARLSILAASAVAGVAGLTLLRTLPGREEE